MKCTNNELTGFQFHGRKLRKQWLRYTGLPISPIQIMGEFHTIDFFLDVGTYSFLSRRSSILLTKFAMVTRCWIARRDYCYCIVLLVAVLECITKIWIHARMRTTIKYIHTLPESTGELHLSSS